MARVHHLNCGTMCPRGFFLSADGDLTSPPEFGCHCVLVETDSGLVLVDTGYGTREVAEPGRLPAIFSGALRPQLRHEETALAQVEALGFKPSDVRHIVATHLDLDHASGLRDFPQAEVHVFAVEHDAAMKPRLRERPRYLRWLYEHEPKWHRHEVGGDAWYGFGSVRVIEGTDSEVALVPLPGHTRGHCGVAVRTGERWLLDCGDAYFHRGQMAQPAKPPLGITIFEGIVDYDFLTRRRNSARLNELVAVHGDEIDVFCAHDVVELERSRERAAAVATVAPS